MNPFKKIFGSRNDRLVKQLKGRVEKINILEPQMEKLSDEELAEQTIKFRTRIDGGESLESMLPEAFATVREASRRVLGMRHYDVQMVGGITLFEGNIAEMKTGEGKTLTATLPLYLHALAGKGAHLVTVNDYLARRDAEWMGQIYRFLGMSVGVILHGLNDAQRKEAYAADITYGTNNEFGFDYLRDNMKTDINRCVQREHNFSIVDEVDSILIDEARTPLIISGPTETNTELYYQVNSAIPGLHKDSDYLHDEKSRTVTLTEDGINKLEKRLRIENLYSPTHIDFLHHVQQALKAHVIFKKDVDYVVRDNKVIIVDEFTGRLMPGRRYSDGLHGALEAKEHLRVEQENQTLATITFQNYFRLYETLAGMTGTADTEALEFKKIYNLDVVVIPTNKPIARDDKPDAIYRSAQEKFNVIADEIAEKQKKGQPVLVGTVSVEKSELLSSLLKRRGTPHEVLNAKNHGREAQIIEAAGQPGHVTISTNMAGRGTDIKLGQGVLELGGLCVIGTERHESRRIDNQLRGRSGRQGDPGETIFYLSLEDDLMRIFASDRISNFMAANMEEGEAIISPMVSRAIEKAQKRVEEQNFSSRKHVIEYDDVMNQQRQVIYSRRRQLLEGTSTIDFIEESIYQVAFAITEKHSPEAANAEDWNLSELSKVFSNEFGVTCQLTQLNSDEISDNLIATEVRDQVWKQYQDKSSKIGPENMKQIENYIYLQIIDAAWKDHLLHMDQLKDSVSLRGYGQRDPLQEYKKEAYKLFEAMMMRIEDETALALVRMPPPEQISSEDYKLDEINEDEMNFQHPQAGSALQQGAAKGGGDDEMIYHGSRSQPESTELRTPFVRQGEKVGRNDPCPCGSGKKYKKCHGRPGGEEPSISP